VLRLPPQLSALKVTCEFGGRLNADRLHDTDMAALVARLPCLCTLELGITGQLTLAAFRIVGEVCRQLERLLLVSKCVLSALKGEGVKPLYLKLQGLKIDWPPADSMFFWYSTLWP
jgi:hypothetical protein